MDTCVLVEVEMDGVVIIGAEEIGVATKELSESFLEGNYVWQRCGCAAG